MLCLCYKFSEADTMRVKLFVSVGYLPLLTLVHEMDAAKADNINQKVVAEQRKLLNLAQTVYGLNKQWKRSVFCFVSCSFFPLLMFTENKGSGDVQLDVSRVCEGNELNCESRCQNKNTKCEMIWDKQNIETSTMHSHMSKHIHRLDESKNDTCLAS